MRLNPLSLAFASGLLASAASSEEIRMIGNSVMFSDRSILSNVINSRDHKTLIKALKSVKLEQPLMQSGSYTLFAPVDAAFEDLPKTMSHELFRRSNRDGMARFLACHIVVTDALAGRKLADLVADGGKLTLNTLGNCRLTLTRKGSHLFVAGPAGVPAEIIAADVLQLNGMVNVIDRVILPSS